MSESRLIKVSVNVPISKVSREELRAQPYTILSPDFLTVVLPRHLPVYRMLIKPLIEGFVEGTPSKLVTERGEEAPILYAAQLHPIDDLDITIRDERISTAGFTACTDPHFARIVTDPERAASYFHATVVDCVNQELADSGSEYRLDPLEQTYPAHPPVGTAAEAY